MPRYLLIILLLLQYGFAFSQKSYFQQKVDYTIDVALDDRNHILRGFETMLYTNESSDTLKVIFIHLWANAYKDDHSSYTEQEVENGHTKFYFSDENDRGFIDSLNFMVDGITANFSTYNNHDDIAIIDLTEPLLPGKTIEISTPFRVVIPYTYSRLGHVGQSYQISQWYPKPAVYDLSGWHPIPYLDQGEFYSEFGSYSVSITLPSNYVVASTGVLQEASEKQFIEAKSKNVDSGSVKALLPISSSEKMKTISFKQNNIHDFAWFADKHFQIDQTICSLPSGKKVTCYSFFKPSNYKYFHGSSEIISKTISYLSQHVGEYPYEQASVVDGALFAGDGMEYPMIAVVGSVNSVSTLRSVIVHEVGHNWFYGLLGSNEREHPWMDEGINTMYEKLIVAEIDKTLNQEELSKIDKLNKSLNGAFLYQLTAINHTDQAVNLPSTEYTYFNYGSGVYQKTASLFAYLKAYLGEATFEKAMKQYFDQWHYKHPSPMNLKKLFQDVSGKELNWFFEQGLNSTIKIDFKIGAVHQHDNLYEVKVKSKTDFTGPVPVQACIHDSIMAVEWIEYPYETPAIFTNLPSKNLTFRVDANEVIPERKLSNNEYTQQGLFHTFKPSIRLGTRIGLLRRNSLFVLPAGGYNYYNKWMMGLAFHNLTIPNKPFQFAFAPLYSTSTKSIVGSGFASYTFYPQRIAQSISLSLHARTYHFDESHLNIVNAQYLQYYKLMPALNIEFKQKNARSPIRNFFDLRCAFIGEQSFKYTLNLTDSLYRPDVNPYEQHVYVAASFKHQHNRTFNPFSYQINAVGNNEFIKAGIEGNLRINYHMKEKSLYIRGFAGMFIDLNESANSFKKQQYYLNSTSSSAADFMYDQVYIARSEQTGFLTHQVSMREGGFKVQTLLLNNPVGLNNKWLTAVNLRSDLPVKFPLKVQLFFDAGTYANAAKENSSGNKLIYDGGVEVHLFSDLLIIYAPLIMSKEFKDYTKSTYPKNRILNTLCFSLNVDKINWQKTQSIIKL